MANTKKVKERVNWPITILLIIGLITIIFPLYMAVVIASKIRPEMTNDIAGHPVAAQHLELGQLYRGHSGHRLLPLVYELAHHHGCSGGRVHSYPQPCRLRHRRNMDHKRIFKWSYYFIIAGMYVPFAILMMPLVKQTAIMHLDNIGGRHASLCGLLHAHEHDALHRLST